MWNVGNNHTPPDAPPRREVDVVAIAEGHTDFATGLAEQNGGKYVTVD